MSKKTQPLEHMTLAWFWHNVPLKTWLVFGAIVVGAFSVGVGVGNTTFVRELLGRQPESSPAPRVGGPAHIAFLADDFILNLTNPYNRPTLTKVSVRVRILSGSVTPLREAELLKFEYDRSKFDSNALGQVRIESVTPSSALFSSSDASAAAISLEFDSKALIPLGNFTAEFKPGDRRPFGHGLVRLFFLDSGKKRHEDVPIQLMFEKQAA